MVDGRWYATATALADGRIMAMSGLTQTGGTSQTIEIYDLQRAGTGWNPPTSVPFTPPLYPRLELLPDGSVFHAGHFVIVVRLASGLPHAGCRTSTDTKVLESR